MYRKLLSAQIPCVVFCRELPPDQEILDAANELGIPDDLAKVPSMNEAAARKVYEFFH